MNNGNTELTKREIIERLRLENRESASKQTESMLEFGNQVEVEAVKMMITLGTFLFLFTSPFIPFIQLPQTTDVEKTILIIGWTIISLSITLGLVQLIVSYNFYKRMAEISSRRVGIFSVAFPSEETYKEMISESKNLQPDGFHHGSLFPVQLQGVLLLLGFTMILVASFIIII